MTNGHLDVVQRAAKLFDRVIVAVAANDEQKAAVHPGGAGGSWSRRPCGTCPNVEVDSFEGLLVDYVDRRSARPSSAVCGPCRILNLNFNWP